MNDRLNTTRSLAMVLAGAWLSIAVATADEETGDAAGTATEMPVKLTLDDFRSFTDAMNLIRQHHVDETPDPEVLDAAIRGMVSELDLYSSYLSARESQLADDTNRGRYGGVGIEIEIRDARLYVLEVVPDSPAAGVDIRVGDRVLAVDDVPVRGRPVDDSFRALHGDPGTEVTIRFWRKGSKNREFTLERTFIPVASVRSELLDDDIAYLNITHFHTGTAGDFRTELSRLAEAAGADGLRGIVIDLRDNTGGVITAAAAIADGFLDSGRVVYTRGRYAPTQMDYHAEAGQWAPDVPVAVLVNRMTASSSEILAAALQDHARATLVGETTFGKGTVQSMFELRNGSALRLTTARFYTPSGRPITEAGITPDVEVTVTENGKDDALERALELFRG